MFTDSPIINKPIFLLDSCLGTSWALAAKRLRDLLRFVVELVTRVRLLLASKGHRKGRLEACEVSQF